MLLRTSTFVSVLVGFHLGLSCVAWRLIRRLRARIAFLETPTLPTAASLTYDRPLVQAVETQNVEHVAQQMHDKGANYAMITSPKGEFEGVVDIPSLLRYILSPRPMDVPISRIVQRCALLPPHTTIDEAARRLSYGIRHVVVLRRSERCLISQRALLKHLIHHAHTAYTEKLERSLLDLSLGNNTVVNCNCHHEAGEAFMMMAAYDITSLPILDADDRIKGVLGASDILYARNDSGRLLLKVLEFLEEARGEAGNVRGVDEVVQAACTATLRTVLALMFDENVHHIYITRDDQTVEGVVSFVDILRVLTDH